MTAVRSGYFYLLAIASSVLVLALMMLGLLYFQVPRAVGVALSLAGPLLLGAVFGYRRPGPSGLPTLCVSSAFCIYFGVVFIALLYNSERDWLVALLAVGTVVTGWLGTMAGGRLGKSHGQEDSR